MKARLLWFLARWFWIPMASPPPDGQDTAPLCLVTNGRGIWVGWWASDWNEWCERGSRDKFRWTNPRGATHWRRVPRHKHLRVPDVWDPDVPEVP